MKSLLPSLTIMIGITFSGLAGRAAEKVASFPAAGREGSSLLPGWLNTRGSQIVDNRGNVVRIASIGWYGTDGPAGYALRGLWTVSYRAICNSIIAAGINTVRIPWSDVNLDPAMAG